jgi:hypothetical protein
MKPSNLYTSILSWIQIDQQLQKIVFETIRTLRLLCSADGPKSKRTY